MVNKKLWIAAISLMIFLNNDCQKGVKAAYNFSEESFLQISEDEVMIPTQNKQYEVISKAAIIEELINNKEFSPIPGMAVANEMSFFVNDVNDIFSTVWELVEFYGGNENNPTLVSSQTEMDKMANVEHKVTGMKITGLECCLGAFDGKRLSSEETRRMLLYGHSEPVKTVVFDEDSSLWQIAQDNALNEEELYLLNPAIKDLKWVDLIGKVLDVTAINPLINIDFETLQTYTSTLLYDTEYIEDENMLEGQLELLQQGSNGQILTKLMTSTDGVTTIEETVGLEVINEIIAKGTKTMNSVGTGQWSWPLLSGEIATEYLNGEMPYGINIAAVAKDPVFAADTGMVEAVELNGSNFTILINHKNGYYSRYGNLSQVKVKIGENVKKGQQIGLIGGHEDQLNQSLYFEIRTNKGERNTYAPNPMNFF